MGVALVSDRVRKVLLRMSDEQRFEEEMRYVDYLGEFLEYVKNTLCSGGRASVGP